jgi:hypothetical protein
MYDQSAIYGPEVFEFNRQNAQPLAYDLPSSVTPGRRGELLGSMRATAKQLKMRHDTWALAVAYVDLFLAGAPPPENLGDLGAAALHCASLISEAPVDLERFYYSSHDGLMRILGVARALSELLDYRYRVPTVADFLRYFWATLSSEERLPPSEKRRAVLLSELALLAVDLLAYHPALLAAACLSLVLPEKTERLARLAMFDAASATEPSVAGARENLSRHLAAFLRDPPPPGGLEIARARGESLGVLAALLGVPALPAPRPLSPPRSPPRVLSPQRAEVIARVARKEGRGKKLGSGSYGKVYSFTVAGKTYAVKRLAEIYPYEGMPPDFAAETSALLQIESRYVITAGVVGVADDRPFVAMEQCTRDLWSAIRTWPSANDPALLLLIAKYTEHTLLGMAAIHRAGLIHCDLKPENILLCGGVAKLADFGISQWQTPPYRPQTDMIYTRSYRPIEHLLGDKTARPSSDLWALGCVVVEMATRKVLFAPSRLPEEIFDHLGFPADWPEFPELAAQAGVDVARTFFDKVPLLPPGLGWLSRVVEQTLVYNPARRTPAKMLLLLPH